MTNLAPLSAHDAAAKRKTFSDACFKNLGLGVVYILIYWLFDWISGLYAPGKLDITPWNPSVAFSLLLVFFKGVRWAPLLFIASLSSQILEEPGSGDVPHILASLCEAAIYSAAGWVLRRRLSKKTDPEAFQSILTLCAVVTIASGLMAAAYVLVFYVAGAVPAHEIPSLIPQYWAGDGLGILLIMPLALRFSENKIFISDIKRLCGAKGLAIVLCIASIVPTVYWSHIHGVHFFYVFFAPVLWVALTSGFAEVVSTVTLLFVSGLFWSWFFHVDKTNTIAFLPFFSMALAWMGLVISGLTQDRQNALLQILKGTARMQALLDMSPDCMLIVDITNKIVAVNRNFARLCGASPEQLTSQPVTSVIPSFTHIFNGETFMQLADHTFMPIDLSTSRVHVGEKYSSILTVRDITVRKQAETEQKERRAISERATRMHLTGGLAAALAHELNQPLSAIISYVSACQKTLGQTESAPPKAIEQLQKISSQSVRAANVIRRLREFYQNSNISLAPAPLSPLIQQTMGFLEDEIIKTNTAVEIRVSDDLTGLIDQVQIEQVVINLVRNSLEALKTMPVDQRKIRIIASKNRHGDLEVIIHDNGPGIPTEIADRLFSPFVTTGLSGMGLGLVICHSIIEAHEGRLWAELQTTRGTAMHFTIPSYEKAQAS